MAIKISITCTRVGILMVLYKIPFILFSQIACINFIFREFFLAGIKTRVKIQMTLNVELISKSQLSPLLMFFNHKTLLHI